MKRARHTQHTAARRPEGVQHTRLVAKRDNESERAEKRTRLGRYRVTRTSRSGLRTVAFACGEHSFDGIEQNPNTTSRWAKLAQQGKRVMQFRSGGRYVGVVVEGKLTHYPAWHSLSLPQ